MIPTPKASSTRENVHETVDRSLDSNPDTHDLCSLVHLCF